MKKILFCSIFIIPLILSAQELVVNGGFEAGNIPNNTQQINKANGWSATCSYKILHNGTTSSLFSSDLYDVRSPSPLVKIPSSIHTTLSERTGGNRYSGIYRGNRSNTMKAKTWNEQINGQFTNYLEKGCYRISFYAAPRIAISPVSHFDPNKNYIDVYLYTWMFSNTFCTDRIKIYSTPNPVNNSSNWTKYEGEFTITDDQANKYKKIGFELREFSNADLIQGVFIDDVSVKKISEQQTNSILTLANYLIINENFQNNTFNIKATYPNQSGQGCNYFWEVCELDANNVCIPGTKVSNSSQWWTFPNPHYFNGYNGTNQLSGNSKGVFNVDKSYYFKFGVWCECSSWNESSWIYK